MEARETPLGRYGGSAPFSFVLPVSGRAIIVIPIPLVTSRFAVNVPFPSEGSSRHAETPAMQAAQRTKARRAGSPDLRVLRAGSDDHEPKDKRYRNWRRGRTRRGPPRQGALCRIAPAVPTAQRPAVALPTQAACAFKRRRRPRSSPSKPS